MVRAGSIISAAVLVISLFGGCSSIDHKDKVAVPSLIEINQLAEIMGLPNVKVVDLRPTNSYLDGHIPNAIQLWRTDIEDSTHTIRGIRASLEQLQHLLQLKGLNERDHIVIYDDKGDVDAARLWWLLKLYSYPKVSLLNGGLQAWKENHLPVNSSMEESQAMGNIQLGPINWRLLTDKKKVLSLIENDHYKIIDARSSDEYSGYIQNTGASRPGRIPGSIFLDYSQTLDQNGRFLQPDELEILFFNHRIVPGDSLIIYCQSGVRSSHLSFVLTEVLGYPNVANYDGSWIEWSDDQELPVEIDSISFTMN